MTRGSDDHLAEALRDLAAGNENDAEPGDGTVENAKPAGPIVEANIATEAAGADRRARGIRNRPAPPRNGIASPGQLRRRHQRRFKATAVPLIATVGLLLLLPAIWGTLLLAGVEVWLSERQGASAMAWTMLICWPIAIALFGSAIFYAVQLYQKRNPR